MSKLEIGLRQGKLLCQMRHGERLDFIAEGLPLILESAHGLWAASRRLGDAPREANILEGHAEEEAAKILILMDIVRCPQKLAGSCVGLMMKWWIAATISGARKVSRTGRVAYVDETPSSAAMSSTGGQPGANIRLPILRPKDQPDQGCIRRRGIREAVYDELHLVSGSFQGRRNV